MNIHKRGFTLIELLIIIIILGVLAGLISGNFISSLKKGRDSRRKADLAQIQRALEMYFEDNRSYPTSLTFGAGFCNGSCTTTKTYMSRVPNDPNYDASSPSTSSTYVYQPEASGLYYYILSCIENANDIGFGVSQQGYAPSCGACGNCKYAIASFNAPILPTLP